MYRPDKRTWPRRSISCNVVTCRLKMSKTPSRMICCAHHRYLKQLRTFNVSDHHCTFRSKLNVHDKPQDESELFLQVCGLGVSASPWMHGRHPTGAHPRKQRPHLTRNSLTPSGPTSKALKNHGQTTALSFIPRTNDNTAPNRSINIWRVTSAWSLKFDSGPSILAWTTQVAAGLAQ